MYRWQLKHSGLLSLVKQSQKNDLTVREFQSVVVRPGDALIDLAKDRSLVLDSAAVPRPQTYPFNLVCEGQLRSGKEANCYANIFRRTEAAGAGFEQTGG